MKKQILKIIYATVFGVIASLAAIELIYLDFFFFWQPFDFAFKYLHIPSLILAYGAIHFDSYIEKKELPSTKTEFFAIFFCFSLIFYVSTSAGGVSMYNRLIGSQEMITFKIEFLEDIDELHGLQPNFVDIRLENGEEYSLACPKWFAKKVEKGKVMELEMIKGSLGFYYNN